MVSTIKISTEDRDFAQELVLAGCTLARSPKKNWIEQVGGELPEYICEVARALTRSGKSVDQAIEIAVGRMKKWAAGLGGVKADTRAKAAKAIAQWEALKAKAKARRAKKLATSNTQPEETLIMALANDYNFESVRAAWDSKQKAARNAYYVANPTAKYMDYPSTYVKEIWSSFIIVCEGYGEGKTLYKVPYSVQKEEITFGESTEVKVKYVEVEDSKISDFDLEKAMLGHPYESSLDKVLRLAADKPYGDVMYADMGYQKDKMKRYPLDTEAHVRAAWSYINMPKNAAMYSSEHLALMKSRIKAAAKKFGIEISE